MWTRALKQHLLSITHFTYYEENSKPVPKNKDHYSQVLERGSKSP